MQEVFVSSITSSCATDYDIDQINIWTSSIQDTAKWHQLINDHYTLLVCKEHEIVGLGSLKNNDILDLLYVSPHVQRQGIAKHLYLSLESKALLEHQVLLTAEVSITALPFFEKMNFEVICEQQKEYKGILFTNFRMQKNLMSI